MDKKTDNNNTSPVICSIIDREDLSEDKTDVGLFNKILDEYEACFKPTLYLNKYDDEILFKIYNFSKKKSKNPAYKQIMKRTSEIIIDYNSCYIKKLVYQFNTSGDKYLREALLQEGYLQMLKAINQYDYTKGNAFITYAHYVLVSGMSTEKRKETKSIQLDIDTRKKIGLINDTINKLKVQLDREPTIFDIAEKTDMTIDEVDKIICLCADVDSIDKYVAGNSEDKETNYSSVLYDRTKESLEEKVCNKSLVEEMSKLIDKLKKDKDKEIIKMRFGIGSDEPMTLQEIADHLGCSKERVRQIEAKALRQLRKLTRNTELKLFL